MRCFAAVAAEPCPLPLYASAVAAGFPSPADDHLEGRVDLTALLVPRPAATFLVRAEGDSMREAGIHPGDLLVVDRSLAPRDGDVVVAALDGELTVKTVRRTGDGGLELRPANAAYAPIPLREGCDLVVWGVVTTVVHRLRPLPGGAGGR
jgi:DNA polymerase V